MLEYDFDIGRAVAGIIVNGVMFRYPNITFITAHSGGTVPMLVGRLKDRVPMASQKLARAFELALLRGNADGLFPKFKART